MALLRNPTHVRQETPVGAGMRGAAAGLVATLLLSVLARILPGMSNRPPEREMPPDPESPQEVSAWQARSQAPAAFRPQSGVAEDRAGDGPDSGSGAILIQPQAPGPEGLAEQFAFKFASGIFDRDISAYLRPAGLAVHLAYGSSWGAAYGLLQASYRQPPGLFGAVYGLLVWLVGPALLVPAMKLMRPPMEEPSVRTAMMLTGHVAYGVTLAAAFEALSRNNGRAGDRSSR